MTLPSIVRLLFVGVLTQVSPSAAPHTWIADVKSNPGMLAGKEVRIEGEVLDLRSTSPAVRRGIYRLADASDPAGVLVRTDKLPMDGGSFRLIAKVAPDQLVPGSLLLDEVSRESVNPRPVAPLAAAAVSAFFLLTLGGLFARSVVAERRYAVAPPLWLMPDAGPYGKALALPDGSPSPLKYQPDLEEADREQREQLKQRRRRLLKMFVVSLGATGASAVWAVESRPVAGQVPAFIFIDSNDPASRASRYEASSTGPAGGDTGVTPPPAPPEPVRPAARVESTSNKQPPPVVAATPHSGGADSVTAPPPVLDTIRRVEALPPAPAPAPAPAPPPPPPPAPAPREVTPDPAVEQTVADETLAGGARRLVAAISDRSLADLAFLLPETMAGDIGRRERFMRLIKDYGAQASLGTVEGVALANGRGEARFTVTIAWRGDFGLDHRKVGTFQGVVRRGTAGWQFEGARLLEAVP